MNTLTTMDADTNSRGTRIAPMTAHENCVAAGSRTLGQAVRAAVDVIADAALKPLSPDEAAPFVLTRAGLALLVECYAQQIYRSTVAAKLATTDPDCAEHLAPICMLSADDDTSHRKANIRQGTVLPGFRTSSS